jgi:hypothetical protein
LDIVAVNGDEVNINVSLGRDISAYTWESYIYTSGTSTGGGGRGSLAGIGVTVMQPTIGISNATAGSMVIGLNEAQTHSLIPGKGYRWYLRWVAPGEVTRTVLSGLVTVVAP